MVPRPVRLPVAACVLVAVWLVGPALGAAQTPAPSTSAPASIDQALEQALRPIPQPGLSSSSLWLPPTADPPGALCRTLTDLGDRTRRARICMTPDRWAVLVAAAHPPGRLAYSGARLRTGWRQGGGTR